MLALATAAVLGLAPGAYAQGAPAAGFSLSSIDFGEVPTGEMGSSQAVSLRNTGSGPMFISSIVAVGGSFGLGHDCPLGSSALAAGTYCTIGVTFAPAQEGVQSGLIQVAIDGLSGPREIPLEGIGVPFSPKAATAVSKITFPDTLLGTTSGPLRVVFTNTGFTDIYVYGVDYLPEYGDFSPYPPLEEGSFSTLPKASGDRVARTGSKVATAPLSCYELMWSESYLYPGDTCYADVYFTPSQLGLRTGQLVLTYEEYLIGAFARAKTLSLAVVQLRGEGVPETVGGISLSTALLDFGGVVVGTSAEATVTVSSTGTVPLAVTGVTTPGPGIFSATTNCDSAVAPGASCTVTVTCRPEALGKVEGDLYVLNSASVSGYEYVRLVCTGTENPVPKIHVSATGLSFGNQSLGRTSAMQDVVIKSVGTAPLALAGIGSDAPFAVSSGCPASLAPGLSCVASVSFTPSAPGMQHGQLLIGSDDPDNPSVSVALSGTGCRPFSVQAARRGLNLCGP